VAQSPFRYATRDVEIGGVLIRQGEPVMMSYAALGRDEHRHGRSAPDFELTERGRQLSFGFGAHYCIGAPLARLEASLSLPALFDQFDLELAVPRHEIVPFPSLALNGIAALPTLVTPR